MNSLSIKKTALIFLTLLFAAQPAALTAEQSAPLSNDWSESISRFFYDRWPIIAGVSAGLLAAAVYIYATRPTTQTMQTPSTQQNQPPSSAFRPEQKVVLSKGEVVNMGSYTINYLPVLQQSSNELCGYYAAFFAINAVSAVLADEKLSKYDAFTNDTSFEGFLNINKRLVIDERFKKKMFNYVDAIKHFLEKQVFAKLTNEIRNIRDQELKKLAEIVVEKINNDTNQTVTLSPQDIEQFLGKQALFALMIEKTKKMLPTLQLREDEIITFINEKLQQSISSLSARNIEYYLNQQFLAFFETFKQQLSNEIVQLAKFIDTKLQGETTITISETFFKTNLSSDSFWGTYLQKNMIPEQQISKTTLEDYIFKNYPNASELIDSSEIELILNTTGKQYASAISIIDSAPTAKILLPIFKLDKDDSNYGFFIIGTMDETQSLASGHWLTVVAEKKNNNRTYYVLNSAANHSDTEVKKKYASIITKFIQDLDEDIMLVENTKQQKNEPLIVIDNPDEKKPIIEDPD